MCLEGLELDRGIQLQGISQNQRIGFAVASSGCRYRQQAGSC